MKDADQWDLFAAFLRQRARQLKMLTADNPVGGMLSTLVDGLAYEASFVAKGIRSGVNPTEVIRKLDQEIPSARKF